MFLFGNKKDTFFLPGSTRTKLTVKRTMWCCIYKLKVLVMVTFTTLSWKWLSWRKYKKIIHEDRMTTKQNTCCTNLLKQLLSNSFLKMFFGLCILFLVCFYTYLTKNFWKKCNCLPNFKTCFCFSRFLNLNKIKFCFY